MAHIAGAQLLRRNNQKLIAVWEKWYKGGWIAASGGIRAMEYWDDNIYFIEISSWSRELEAEVVADNLTRWFADNTQKIEVQYKKRPYIDMR